MARSITATAVGSGRNKAVLLLAAVFGILSAMLMFAFLSTRGGDSSDKAINDAINSGNGAESVVVLTRDVPAGERITSDMLTTRTIPASALLEGRIDRVEDVVDKVATAPLFAGEQVIAAKVTTYEGQTTLAYKIPDGKRALSLMVPHEAWIAGGLVQPGDRVDIYGITTLSKVDPLTGQERPDIIAGIIAQDIEVLAVSQTLVKVIPNLDERAKAGTTPAAGTTPNASGTPAASAVVPVDSGVAPGEGDTYEKAVSITLALTPDEAAKVGIIDAMEDSKGQFRIVPRQKGDDTPVNGQLTWSLDEVFGPTKK